MHHDREPAQARATLDASHEVARNAHPLDGVCQHEIPGVQDERLARRYLDALGRVRRNVAWIDAREARGAEHHEATIEPEVDAGGLNLQVGISQGSHDQVAFGQPLSQVTIGENHRMVSITEVA